MVIWHIETDFVALAIYIVLFVKAVLLNKKKDLTDKIFSLALILGIVSTGIDIFSSEMMNERMGWWIYEISMIIYGLSVPILVMIWFMYTITIIYKGNDKAAKGLIGFFCGLYVMYAAIIVTNPLHELYFSLSEDIVYARGAWFLPLIVGSQTFFSALGILFLLRNVKRMESKAVFALLVFLYFVTALSYYIQIAHPGWLIVCATYAVAFLVCDATFESQRRDALYRKITQSLEQLKEDKEKELAYQKKLELAAREATHANLVKSEFLSRMSHDIRTPINGIRGMLEIIRRERHDEGRVDDCLYKIEGASSHLLSLINDVLDMSKLESGEIILAREPFDLCRMAEDCVSVMSPTAVDSGIKLTIECAREEIAYPYLIGSPLHLRQILLNLIGNAIKYNKPGGTVWCHFHEVDYDGEKAVCRFIVRDTGIGISPEFMGSMFEPFTQEHVGSRSEYEGTGLGLAIVKKIVDKMGGEIQADSRLGEGSTFTVTLPFAVDHNPPESAPVADQVAGNRLDGVHLLLVEDNELNMEIGQYILEAAGAIVDIAVNGQEAVNLFKNAPAGTYGAILMDVMMPVMDGLAATRTIRALDHGDAARIPIIAMTANAFSEDRQKCREAGMDAHLAKPLDAAAMIKTIQAYVGRTA